MLLIVEGNDIISSSQESNIDSIRKTLEESQNLWIVPDDVSLYTYTIVYREKVIPAKYIYDPILSIKKEIAPEETITVPEQIPILKRVDEVEIVSETFDLDFNKERLYDYVEKLRWVKETSGIVFNTWEVYTDRESQNKILSAYVAARDGLRTDPSYWKFKHGFELLSNDDVINLALSVLNFIQGCYDEEQNFREQIASCIDYVEIKNLYNSINIAYELDFLPQL